MKRRITLDQELYQVIGTRKVFSALSPGLKKCIALLSVVISITFSAASFSDVKTVSIYKIAPGKQLEFIQWMAAWDEVYEEIGLEQPVWYRNIRGDSWDFVIIFPPFDRAKEDEMEKVGKARGLDVGFAWKLKHWELVAENTGTLSYGPTTPEELLKSLELE
jgi:hypothetical protein